MRSSLLIIAFAIFVCASAQPAGTYMGKSWSVSTARALIWDAKPFIPIGWRILPKDIKPAADSGLKDVVLDLGANEDWKLGVQQAEANGLRYILSVASTAKSSPAFIIKPSSYRIDNVPRRANYDIPITNGKSVFYLLLSVPDYAIAAKGWADVTSGSAKISVDENISSPSYLLLIYPRVASSELPDYWEGFDKARDGLLAKLRGAGLGAGLRGVLNPAGTVDSWISYGGGVVPDSAMFRLELEAFLKNTYKDVISLERAWRFTSSEVKDFAAAARLIALFDSARGVDALYDPQNNVFIPVQRVGCSYWRDMQTVIENAASRRTARLAKAIRQVADVPVIYEWSGWSPVYDTREPSGDGLGMPAIGTGLEPIENSAANAASTLISRNNLRWLIATDMNGPYGDEKLLRGAVTDTSELGAKGWFIKWTGGAETPWLKTMAQELAADASVSTRSPSAVFYPENARNPATTMRLPGGTWWLPMPAAGNRVDIGSEYEAYRLSAPFANFIALWRLGAPAKVKLRMAEPERAQFSRYDGQPVPTKLLKDGVELVLDNLPVIVKGTDEIPIPQDTLDTARADFQSLVAEAQKQKVDVADLRFGYEEAARNINKNPGAAYEKMAEALTSFEMKIAPFTWIEGESSRDNSFSQIIESTSCANGKALSLDTPLKPPAEGYVATYNVKTKPGQEDMDVWMAAKIPEKVRPFVSVDISGTQLALKDAQSGYGDGYAWYHLGRVNLRKGSYTLTVRVSQSSPLYRASIDAILVTPLQFQPLGPRIPRYVPGS